MREHGGVIVNTASMAGPYPIPGDPIYPAAKAG
jgi:NADP-dependent 3-hydroxy acid dehydrogenase YdfG